MARPCSTATGSPSRCAKTCASGADALDARGADEDAVERLGIALELELGLERVHLTAVAVALHDDVDDAEQQLAGQAVAGLPGEQDHARAGAEQRALVARPAPRRGPRRRAACRSSSTRRRAARAPRSARARRRAHLDRVGAQGTQQRDVLAERALQREHADAGRAHQPRLASRSSSSSLSSPMPTIGAPSPSETRASSLASLEVRDGLDDRPRARRRIVALEDAGADEAAVGAELHHHRRVGGRRDAAGGEHHHGQAAELGGRLDELVRRAQVLGARVQLVRARARRARRCRGGSSACGARPRRRRRCRPRPWSGSSPRPRRCAAAPRRGRSRRTRTGP